MTHAPKAGAPLQDRTAAQPARHETVAQQARGRIRSAGAPRTLGAIGAATGLVAGLGLVAVNLGTAEAAPKTIRIDVGGKGGTAADGTSWSADTGYSSSRAVKAADRVRGSTPSSVLATGRVARSLNYQLKVPNGQYRVKLIMVETYWRKTGQRVQSASAEGKTMFTNLDLVRTAGRGNEVDRELVVNVMDGRLDLAVKASKDLAIVSGIVIDPTSSLGDRDTNAKPPKPADGTGGGTVDPPKPTVPRRSRSRRTPRDRT